jgi:HB1/ASXL restriction endonuclease-like protein with HTH domain
MAKTKTATKKANAPKAKKNAKAAPKKAKAASANGKPKKMSAIDVAAKVLADSGKEMNCKELIEAMGAKGLWTSPGGATPHQTLYSAIAREIQLKGKEARFMKTVRGKFAAN